MIAAMGRRQRNRIDARLSLHRADNLGEGRPVQADAVDDGR